MELLKWINDNREILAWWGALGLVLYKAIFFIRKKWYVPGKAFFEKVNYEINNNGGKSIKDLVEKTNVNLQKLLATQEAMLSISEQAIFKCNEDGDCTFANESLCELYGAAMEDMLGFGWVNFIKESERDAAEKNWKRSIQHDRQITYSYTVVNGDTGKEIPCYYRAAIKRDAENKIISILGVVFKK